MAEDSVTEVTTQGWFSRIGDSIKGVLFGILLILASFGLLFWNEGRAVKTAQSLEEGAAAVISVPADATNPTFEGKLVHMTGTATANDVLTDPDFGISLTGLRLKRTVEMYQWREESQSREEKKLGGGTQTTTTYTYKKEWSSSLISSSGFKKQEGHDNPAAMRFEANEITASKVDLGAFTLPPSLVGKISFSEILAVTEENRAALPEGLRNEVHVMGGGFYVGQDPAAPRIGDCKVTFHATKPLTVSLVARQKGNTFEPYPTAAGREIELLEVGARDAGSMFQVAQAQNTTFTWILRAAGFFLMMIGFSMIFRPLVVVADFVPFIGSILDFGTGIVSFLAAAVLSLATIAIAWIFYRPLLGISLLVLAALLLGGGIYLASRRAKPGAA